MFPADIGTRKRRMMHSGEMGTGADDLLDSTASMVRLRWISASQPADNLVHGIHSPIYHLIHSFIYLSC